MQKRVSRAFETFETVGEGQSHEKKQKANFVTEYKSNWAMPPYGKENNYKGRPLYSKVPIKSTR